MLQIKSYKKKDGKTYYKFQTYLGTDEYGKVVRASRSGFTTKTDARKKAMELKAQFQSEGYQKPTYETFEEVAKLWFEAVYMHEVRESTAVKTRELFNNHVLKDLGGVRIDKISPQQCQRAVIKWSGKTSKAKVMKNYCSRIFNYANVTLGIINKNPMENVEVPKKTRQNNNQIDFYDKEELKLFLDCAKQEQDPKWFVLFRLLAFSGMRKGEALGLQWNKINFEEKTVTIDTTLARGRGGKLILQDTKTTAGERTISLDDVTLNILKQWRTKQRLDYLKLGMNTNQPTQNVFTNQTNGYIQHAHVTTVMQRIIDKHDLKKITTHQLRHTHCSLLFEANATIKEVQERLGHSSYDVTLNIYTHVTEEKKEETANKFADYVGF